MAQLKRGKISKADNQFIQDNMDKLSAEEIAGHINRSPEFVQKILNRLAVTTDKGVEDATLAALHNSYYWPVLQNQLIGAEVRYFEMAWMALSQQFSQHGIMASDETSIKDLIMHEVHHNRAVTKKTQHIRDIDELEDLIDREMEVDIDARDVGSLSTWEQQRAALIAAMDSLTNEALEYQKKKDEKLKQLKATRESRLKNAEQSKSNFWALMREMNDPDMLKKWMEYTQKMHLGAEIVRLEWGEMIEFEDGKYDKPFVSPEGEMRDEKLDQEAS
jgi:hypothetical protein